jgi:hypothetical protein
MPSKLGSNDDPIRQGLFACQSMKELLGRTKLDGSPSPFQTISDAAMLAAGGKKQEAKQRLRSILALSDLETRAQLWVWTALRGMGEQPDPKSGWEILGVVVEVPVQGAYDTLAGYQDGSARYLNFSGSAIFWDAPDAAIKNLCQALLGSAVSAASRAKPRRDVSLPRSGMHATLLTRFGNYVISDPPETTGKVAAALMAQLISRAEHGEGG